MTSTAGPTGTTPSKKIMLWYLLSWSTKWVLPTHGEEYRHRKKNCATLAKIKTTPKPSHRTGVAGWVGASSPYPRHLGHKLGTHTLHHAGCHQGLPCPVVVKQRCPRAGKHQGGITRTHWYSTRFEGHVGIGDPLRTTSFH
jgi:hypothetical protein